MRIEVHVSTSVNSFKDLHKSAHRGHCMYKVFFEYVVSVCSSLSISLAYSMCVSSFLLNVHNIYFCCYPTKSVVSIW